MLEILAEPAVKLCVIAAGVFFMTGLLTGTWKYAHIARSATATAPAYVDIAHRAALMYSSAALLLAVFAGLSAWSDRVNLVAAALPLAFFAFAIVSYIVHGVLRDTENQMRKPHVLGKGTVHPHMVTAYMWLLMAAEIGGFAVLFAGFLATL